MASQNNNRNDQVGNFAGLLIALILVAVFILIVSSTSGLDLNLFAATEAAVVPTETPTPLPPTETPTPEPTATPTPLPTDTPVPPTATATPLPPTNTPAPTEAPQEPAAEASGAAYDPELIAAGEQLYITCVGCHGADAHGVPNLGKELVGTEFMRTRTDEELRQFIIMGRPIWDPDNTSGIDMPSRGGNPALSNDDILAIIAYLRSLDTDAEGAPPAEEEAPAAEGDASAYDPELIAAGEQLYITCAGCHGFDAHGVPNLGKELVGTEFMRTRTDEELRQFIIMGRPIWDPDNTSGIDMPSRGGNPALSNDDILAIIAYLRSLDTGD